MRKSSPTKIFSGTGKINSMSENEERDFLSPYYIDRCMHCDFNPKEDAKDLYAAQCHLCYRCFERKKLFLNNVG